MRGVGSKGKEVGLAPEWNDVFKRAAANVTIETDDEVLIHSPNIGACSTCCVAKCH
jgi:hypothetical protein